MSNKCTICGDEMLCDKKGIEYCWHCEVQPVESPPVSEPCDKCPHSGDYGSCFYAGNSKRCYKVEQEKLKQKECNHILGMEFGGYDAPLDYVYVNDRRWKNKNMKPILEETFDYCPLCGKKLEGGK